MSPNFKGTRYTNTGSRITYRGRLVKIVRANHYVDYIASMIPHTPFIVIMRNPFSCIASRIQAGWPVPDHSHSINDIAPLLSDKQLSTYHEAGSIVSRLAVSWCLDNFMLLRNEQSRNFCFVNYESILAHPEIELKRLLLHIDRGNQVGRISRELMVESDDYDLTRYLDKWKKSLSVNDVRKIADVLKIYDLDGYYDMETGMPTNKFPFC